MPYLAPGHSTMGRAKKPSPPPLRGSKSINEFCASHGISRKTFDNWVKAGKGPRLLRPVPGGRILITDDAERDWLRQFATDE